VASGSSRSRGVRGVEGIAQARSYNGGGYYPSHPVHYPSYGYGYPAYGYGYGYYPGYASVGFGYPWYCCGSFTFGMSVGFGWGGAPYYGYPYAASGYPYGAWYGPGFWGAPYAPVYVPVPYGVSVGDGSQTPNESRGPSESREERRPTGSVRLRANPPEARVYVDGALAGTVDDFNGFSDQLKLEVGRHVIELRADGYQPYSTEVIVAPGRTMTARANLTRTP